MDGLFFLVACVAIGLVQLWVFRNDSAGPTERTTGLFAMRPAAPRQSAEDKASRRQAARRRGWQRPG